MKICHVWDADYPWDVRVEKISRALTDAGHRVDIIARNRTGSASVERLEEGIVHRLRHLPGGRRLNAFTSFPAFFNPRWIARIREVACETDSDIILVRDLPLAPAAIRAAKVLGIPVALDMAENYPGMIRAIWEAGRQKPWDVFVRNPRLVKAVEEWVLARVDAVFVVVEESGERLVKLGVSPKRVTVVSNTPPRSRLESPPRDHITGGPLRLFYLGLLEAPRGIAESIRAVAVARQAGVDVQFDLVGDGRERPMFVALAQELGLLGGAVRFHGHVPYLQGLAMMAGADIGVIPHYANESWDTTIPNKLFDYMAAGLPVLTSPAKPAARIVEETGAGVVFRDRDPWDAARAIGFLAEAKVRRRLGQAGRHAVESRYYWERDAERLERALVNLADPVPGSGADPDRRQRPISRRFS